jgi:hypothetical protein
VIQDGSSGNNFPVFLSFSEASKRFHPKNREGKPKKAGDGSQYDKNEG